MHSLIELVAPRFDFGYTWPWTHGHLVAAGGLALAAAAAYRLRARVVALLVAGVAAWALAGFLVVQLVFGIDRPMSLPTPAFLAADRGRVLDLGAGSGRSSLMVLTARPGVTLVGLDDWSADYFDGHGPERLRANAARAGVADRLAVETADMRALPFDGASFDAIVSTYAIDHLNARGREAALAEAYRVLRPGGEFLLMVLHRDGWARFVYGPLAAHHGYAGHADAWVDRLSGAGFELAERGFTPATAYFLARKPPTRRG